MKLLLSFFIIACIRDVRNEVVFKNDDETGSNRSAASMNSGSDGGNGTREGRNLFNWISSFTDTDADPYLAKANAVCLEGDLSECFKAKALSGLDEFFTKESYSLNDNARIIRMPDEHVRSVYQEPYEFTSSARSEEPEWDQFVKFLMRKVERFLKSTAIEVKINDEVTEQGRYSPRFIDEISSELDTIEDKKAGVITRHKLKKMLIPMLIVLKLFKLKLLLFLPLILGLASFKKFLGFLAIVVPGLIGFFKLCKPDLHHNYGSFGHSNFYHRPPHHFSAAAPDTLYVNKYNNRETGSPDVIQYLYDSYSGSQQQPDYYGNNFAEKANAAGSSPVAFREDAHKLAYNGYQNQ
ncbi:uncharacterized protein Osi2 [Planococcus citri]|uniref:uncharacterized protein Osi2 n=1 Tax=Planococcus citri TaxID=170843 RepID=UPI0031F91759